MSRSRLSRTAPSAGGIASWASVRIARAPSAASKSTSERSLNCRKAVPDITESLRTTLSSLVFQPPLISSPSFIRVETRADGHHLSDCIFAGLLSGPIALHDWDYLEKILILLFTPTAHAVVRHVSCHYQFLAREDLSQLALTTLIESLRSKTWQSQRSHFGYTVARSLRRRLFQWARDEFQSTSQFAAKKIGLQFPRHSNGGGILRAERHPTALP